VRWHDRFATPAAKRTYVRSLFSTIADRYDLITVLLSFGRDRRWKRRLVDLAHVMPGARALDLACGTGDLAFELARRGARVTALDITMRMLELARRKRSPGARVALVAGDMAALPFPSCAFDVVSTGYGLRNVPALDPALAEIGRVLKPGGVLLSLDFNRPESLPVRAVYLGYLTAVGSLLGWALHGDPDTYRYIPQSIRRYPGARAVCAAIRGLGFSSCDYIPVLGGLMAIHVARK
jgi:demethylmenaquinone methyltransferase/2-methoxy-6-polyprenyl-1,4-benzoquinol methylase